MTDSDYNSLAPARQIYTGPLYDESPEAWREIRGQLNPRVQNRFAMQHGRYLSGLGDNKMSPSDGIIDHTAELAALEEQDDVYGSGIFDGPRRGATANVDTGVFESHYNLPGYLGRQQPFSYSEDVTSLPSGAAYAEVPSGGMHYVETHGRPADFQWPGDFPLSEPDNRMKPYLYLNEDHDQEGVKQFNPPSPDTGPAKPPLGQYTHSPYYRVAEGHAARQPAYRTISLPTRPASRPLARRPAHRYVPRRAYGEDPSVCQTDDQCGEGMYCGDDMTCHAGERPSGTHWLVYLGVGLGVGAVAAMVVETVRGK